MFGPRSPMLSMEGLSDGEKDVVRVVKSALDALGTWTAAFRYALALYEESRRTYDRFMTPEGMPQNSEEWEAFNRANAWIDMAGRDGAMSIHNVGTCCEGAGLFWRRAPSLKVDEPLLNDTLRKLRTGFREREAMRNAVAHPVDKLVKEYPEHVFSGDYTSTFPTRTMGPAMDIRGVQNLSATMWSDENFVVNWDGRMLNYSMSRATLQRLEEIRDGVWAAFPT